MHFALCTLYRNAMTSSRKDQQAISRILDANLNRLSEGLRVVEDVLRFGRNAGRLSAEARRLRHAFGRAADALVSRRRLVLSRSSARDVGAGRWRGRRRGSLNDLRTANLRRAQESARVLEECARLLGSASATRAFQRLRYRTYVLESRAGGKGE